MSEPTILAVIPARGGSKRLPMKNIKLMCGLPMIAWTILAAKYAKVTGIVVSTDDNDIEDIARDWGCEVLRRPPHLGSDTATNENVCRHALSAHPASHIILLQPTSPLRLSNDIDAVIDRLLKTESAIVTYNQTGQKNGAVYGAPSRWLLMHDFSAPHIHHEMPDSRSIDVDTQEDFDKAEAIMRERLKLLQPTGAQ